MKRIALGVMATVLLVVFAVGVIASAPTEAASPLTPQQIKSYIVHCSSDRTGINLKLSNDGLRYGLTWEGARNLARYAVANYRQSQAKDFPRPTTDALNAVDAEIRDHCRWALGRGVLGRIPWIRERANPINIGINDRPPGWVFGEIKWDGRKPSMDLRGSGKVRGEFSLMCLVHNVKKIVRCSRALCPGSIAS